MNERERERKSESPNGGTDAQGDENHQEHDERSVARSPGFRVRTGIRAGHEVGVIE